MRRGEVVRRRSTGEVLGRVTGETDGGYMVGDPPVEVPADDLEPVAAGSAAGEVARGLGERLAGGPIEQK